MFNFANHDQHGVDVGKYYRAAVPGLSEMASLAMKVASLEKKDEILDVIDEEIARRMKTSESKE
jgi:C-terminal of NADH-ubiquinone oxidoreductase 21 kDa subunit